MEPVKKKHSDSKKVSSNTTRVKHQDSVPVSKKPQTQLRLDIEETGHVRTSPVNTTKGFQQANPITTSGPGSSASDLRTSDSGPRTSATGANTPLAAAATAAAGATALPQLTSPSLAPDMSQMLAAFGQALSSWLPAFSASMPGTHGLQSQATQHLPEPLLTCQQPVVGSPAPVQKAVNPQKV